MKVHRALAGLVATGALGCRMLASSDADLPLELRDPELGVYEAVINNRYPPSATGDPYIIAEVTTTRFAADSGRLVRDSAEARAQPMVPDFIRRNREQRLLPRGRLRYAPGGLQWLSANELPPDSTSPEAPEYWARMKKRFPGLIGIYRFSRPGFDPSGMRAWLVEELICAPREPKCHKPMTAEVRQVIGGWKMVRIQYLPPVPWL